MNPPITIDLQKPLEYVIAKIAKHVGATLTTDEVNELTKSLASDEEFRRIVSGMINQ